jgi:hypothetical protein
MVSIALLVESALTLGLSLLSLFVSIKTFQKHREDKLSPQIFLAFMLLFFFLSYITEFVVDLYDINLELTGEPLYGDLSEDLRQAVTWASVALVPVFGVLFALEILQPRRKRLFQVLDALVFVLFMALYYLFPHTSVVYEEFGAQVNEINPSLEWSIACYIVSLQSFIPGLIFLVYGLKHAALDRKRALLMSLGFFIISYFGFFSDVLLFPPTITIRRAFLFAGVLLVYVASGAGRGRGKV